LVQGRRGRLASPSRAVRRLSCGLLTDSRFCWRDPSGRKAMGTQVTYHTRLTGTEASLTSAAQRALWSETYRTASPAAAIAPWAAQRRRGPVGVDVLIRVSVQRIVRKRRCRDSPSHGVG
jgi:hypothetical protein